MSSTDLEQAIMTKRRTSTPTTTSSTNEDASDLVRAFTGLPRSVQILALIAAIVFGLVLLLNPGLLGSLTGAATPTVRQATALPTMAATQLPATARPTATDSPVVSIPTLPASSVDVRYPAMPQGLTRVEVVRVVDGDTVRINLNGVEEPARLIGLNTPETVAPNRPVECFGAEASARAHALLDNQIMYFETDDTQDTRDRYGRVLGYLWSEDGRLFNMQMIAEGYAYEYTYDAAYKYQNQFRAAQRDAEAESRGLWSPNTCNGGR
jgi:micrococcal nuclease